MTSPATPNSISSPALADGLLRSALLAGPTLDLFGQALVPASLSATQVSVSPRKTRATCGLGSAISSHSASLQRRLASRLRAKLDVNGSPEYVLTWKDWDMKSGPRICALRARARPKSGKGFSGWATPAVHDTTGARSPEHLAVRRQRAIAKGVNPPGESNLNEMVQLAGWAAPAASEAGGTPEQFLARKERARANGASLGVSLTSLSMQVQLAGWPAPMAGSAATEKYNEAGNTDSSRKTVSLVSGTASASSFAPTGKRGVLSPEHSRWLMGYPVAWGSCGVTAMQSCRRSRSRSSKPAKKPATKSDAITSTP